MRRHAAAMAVAIVNYNTREHLRACLASVVPEYPARVMVVDNGSTDGSPELVAREFPEVELLPAGNAGFGAGANVGIRQAGTPYVLLLNSDTRLHPGALDALAAYLDEHPRVGMVGPKLVNPDGTLQPSIYPTPSPIAEAIRWTSLAALAARLPRWRRKYFVRWPHVRAEAVGWVAGAALGIRREAFDAVGGFDTSFFMYSEEVDLAYCMEKAGWAVHFTPAATVTHYGGASTEAHRAEMMARLFQSMQHFYRKHFDTSWQRQLKVLITYFMVRNLVRDRIRLLRGRWTCEQTSPSEHTNPSEQLKQDMIAWRQVLAATWRRSHG